MSVTPIVSASRRRFIVKRMIVGLVIYYLCVFWRAYLPPWPDPTGIHEEPLLYLAELPALFSVGLLVWESRAARNRYRTDRDCAAP